MRHNQKHLGILGDSERFEARAIIAAWLGMAKHLRARPKPRAQFDEVAAGRAATPGAALVRGARLCLDAARGKDAATLDATRTEVEHFFDTLKTAALRGYQRGNVSAELAIVDFAREASEAECAVTQWAVSRSPDAAMSAQKEIRELIPAAERVLRLERALPAHALPMGAMR